MLVIPAIDLKGGECVRLRQGDLDAVTVFDTDPVKVARRFAQAGAKRLHVVDLDGAAAGKPVNDRVIHAIADAVPDVPIQVGGGIRDEETIEAYLDAGVSFVILGTQAVRLPHFVADACVEYPGHIMVGLDARGDRVAVDAWSKLSTHTVLELAQRFERDGVSAIIYTDIGRDGMLSGVNVEAVVALARAVAVPIIASGGVRDLADITALCSAREDGVTGVVVGRALYEGTIDLGAAIAIAAAGAD